MKLFKLNRSNYSHKSEMNRIKPIEKFRNIQLINQYSKFSEDLQDIVDERTWNDLELDSIFSYIDRTLTKTGEQYLYRLLQKEQSISQNELMKRIISHYSKNSDQLSKSAQILEKYERNSTYGLPSFFIAGNFKSVAPWIKLLSLTFICLMVGSFFLTPLLLPLIISFLINTYVHYYLKTRVNTYHYEFKNIKALYDCYLKLHKVENQDTYLSTKEITSLRTISKKCFYLSLNIEYADEFSAFIYYLIEIIKAAVLYDGLQFNKTIKLLKEHAHVIQKTFDYIGISDTAQSLYYLKGHTNGTEPTVSTNRFIQVQNARHPLIQNCIPNSLRIEGQNIIITGGNMSGKTTFLKTIGINVILSQTINYAFCEYIEIPKQLKISTSITSADSLLHSKSYFMDELERAKTIISAVHKDETVRLILMDELFRGTNSIDRISISAAFLLFLNEYNCKVVVTTHDLDTIHLLHGEYDTYYFDNTLRNNRLHFNYQLQKGIQYKTNVIDLLKSFHYPLEIIQQAELFRKKLTDGQ